MDHREKRHRMDLAKHRSHEETLMRKRAGTLRRGLRKGKGEAREHHVTEANWEEIADRGHVKVKRPSLDQIVEDLRQAADLAVDPVMAAAEWQGAGIVIAITKGRCRVFADDQEKDCELPPELALRQKSALAVGDRVIAIERNGGWAIERILPRRTVLARPDPINRHVQRVIAANVDVVIHVVSLKAPPLRPRLIDRFLIAIQRGGAQPVLCVNKFDLADSAAREEALRLLAPYQDLAIPVVPCSVVSGEGIEALRAAVNGKTAALVGHSGVGKSSILNALDLSLQLATNTLHRRGTGRHTTTSSTLYDFGGGTWLIDTPGIREFGLWDLDRESLRGYFPEMLEAADQCRFTDCTHVHEPDCEVKRRLGEGITQGRYDTYVRLYESLE